MTAPKSTKSANGKKSEGFTAVEKAAMKNRAKELKAQESAVEAERAVEASIADLPVEDRVKAERIHAIIKANAPELSPKTWYGMPAYANKDGKIVCFYQSAKKFSTRYSTFGFNDDAHLDDGNMWPTAYAIMDLTPADEEKIIALVKKAIR